MRRALHAFGLLALAACAFAQTAVGYRGDGSMVFSDARPPTSFDETTGKNLLWKAPLPHWGHSSPIAVAGKVFVTCEPGYTSDWPILLCLDAATGKVLWQQALNHLPATGLSDAEQQQVAAAWHQHYLLWGDGYARVRDYRVAKTLEEKQAIVADLNGKGYRGRRNDDYSGEFKAPIPVEMGRLLARGGLRGETWREGGALGTACVGQTYATPVSDGQCVYVATAFGALFCYDLQGNLKWLRYVPGSPGEYCRNGRSPIIYQDLVISDVEAMVRAFDKRTGELQWAYTVDDETIMTPTTITANGRDILLCFNKRAFLLPEGTPLTVQGGTDFGGTALTKYDERDVVFFTGGGEHGGWLNKGGCPTPPPSCVKFTLDGTTLKGEVRWSGITVGDARPVQISDHTGITYYAGKLYHVRGCIVDADTGKVLQGTIEKRGPRATPKTKHLLAVANGFVYGINEVTPRNAPVTGVVDVYTLDGKKVAESTLAVPTPAGDKLTQVRRVVGNDTWDFNYGCPFTISGDRLYIRSNDYLYCIGETK